MKPYESSHWFISGILNSFSFSWLPFTLGLKQLFLLSHYILSAVQKGELDAEFPLRFTYSQVAFLFNNIFPLELKNILVYSHHMVLSIPDAFLNAYVFANVC